MDVWCVTKASHNEVRYLAGTASSLKKLLGLKEQYQKTPISALKLFVVKDGCRGKCHTRASMKKWMLKNDGWN